MKRFLLAALVLAAAFKIFPGDFRLFRSNSLGMILEEIPEFRRGEYPWVLEQETASSGDRRTELRRLYNQRGDEEKRWEREFFRGLLIREKETVFSGAGTHEGAAGRPSVSEESFYQDGLLIRQIITGSGAASDPDAASGPGAAPGPGDGADTGAPRGTGDPEPEPEIRDYRYAGGVLKDVTCRRGNEILYRDEYLIGPAGRLLRIHRTFFAPGDPETGAPGEPLPAGETSVNYMFGRDRLLRERFWDGNREQIFLFDENYRISRENREAQELLRSERWYVRDGIRYRLETFPRENLEILSEYDQEDRLVRETRTFGQIAGDLAGDSTETIDYRWDGVLLAEKNRRLPGLREQWVYEYEGEQLIKEEKYTNRLLSLVIHYLGTGRRREEIFRNGVLLAVVDYENDLPVGTRFFGSEAAPLGSAGAGAGDGSGTVLSPEADR